MDRLQSQYREGATFRGTRACRTRLGPWLAGLTSFAAEGLFPNYCCLCGLRSFRELPLCQACQGGLSPNNKHCGRCAIPLSQASSGSETTGHRICGQCLQHPPAFDRVVAPWLYEEQVALLIHRWKFHGEHRLSSLFAHLWLCQEKSAIDKIDLIIPVPLHWSRFWRRGFNQSQLFAEELQRQCEALEGVQLAPRWVQRHRATFAQSGLDALQRKTNLLAAFTARWRCDNLRVAIVDDVLTTGATATAMATTLRDAGAKYIEIWCLARTPEPGN